ncbi:hypothetical protein DOTSEDRAFT_71744, partial [Dothistroma septosporum NZE10]
MKSCQFRSSSQARNEARSSGGSTVALCAAVFVSRSEGRALRAWTESTSQADRELAVLAIDGAVYKLRGLCREKCRWAGQRCTAKGGSMV